MSKTPSENRRDPSSVEIEQERNWVKRAQAGSIEAFEHLANIYYQAIFNMIYYRTHSRMDAEDISQDVFLKAYQGLHRLKDEKRFKGWLFRIALNRTHDFHRRKKFLHLFRSLSDDDVHESVDAQGVALPDPLDALIRKRFREESERYLSRLSKMEKNVFMLRFFDQLRISDIAMALDKRESTVKTHLYRALSKFKHDRTFRDFLKGDQR